MPSHCWHVFPAFLVERMASECYLLCLWRQLASSHVSVCMRPELETRDSSRLSPPPTPLLTLPTLLLAFGVTEQAESSMKQAGYPGQIVVCLPILYWNRYVQRGP